MARAGAVVATVLLLCKHSGAKMLLPLCNGGERRNRRTDKYDLAQTYIRAPKCTEGEVFLENLRAGVESQFQSRCQHCCVMASFFVVFYFRAGASSRKERRISQKRSWNPQKEEGGILEKWSCQEVPKSQTQLRRACPAGHNLKKVENNRTRR